MSFCHCHSHFLAMNSIILSKNDTGVASMHFILSLPFSFLPLLITNGNFAKKFHIYSKVFFFFFITREMSNLLLRSWEKSQGQIQLRHMRVTWPSWKVTPLFEISGSAIGRGTTKRQTGGASPKSHHHTKHSRSWRKLNPHLPCGRCEKVTLGYKHAGCNKGIDVSQIWERQRRCGIQFGIFTS